MKTAAYIFFFILGFLTIQPVLSSMKTSEDLQCCLKDHCSKSQNKVPKKNKCENNGCNPFMACGYGNFFLILKPIALYTFISIPNQRIIAINDNRVVGNLSDCWHPPEIVSYYTEINF